MATRELLKTGAMLAALLGGSVAHAESTDFMLRYVVPVQCTITQKAGVAGVAGVADAVGLGAIREYCNAARGYALVVHYAPGSLRGMVLIAGDDRITLDGTGEAIVARSPIPRIRDRTLAAIPGPQGFDTDHLDFEAIAE